MISVVPCNYFCLTQSKNNKRRDNKKCFCHPGHLRLLLLPSSSSFDTSIMNTSICQTGKELKRDIVTISITLLVYVYYKLFDQLLRCLCRTRHEEIQQSLVNTESQSSFLSLPPPPPHSYLSFSTMAARNVTGWSSWWQGQSPPWLKMCWVHLTSRSRWVSWGAFKVWQGQIWAQSSEGRREKQARQVEILSSIRCISWPSLESRNPNCRIDC